MDFALPVGLPVIIRSGARKDTIPESIADCYKNGLDNHSICMFL